MASITIRNLDKSIKEKLRIRAAMHGRSLEEEVRTILKKTVTEEPGHTQNLADSIRERFEPLGGVDLPEPEREPIRKPADYN